MNHTALLTATSAFLIGLTAPAIAEQATTKTLITEQSTKKISGLESVTVVGQSPTKAATLAGIKLKDLPVNAYVIHREEIERLQFIDPNGVLDRIPGESQVRNLRIPAGGKSYTIPMVDGIPLENPYEGATERIDLVNTQDIDSIQVIKGPSSALYYNNALGGVINVVTRNPPEQASTQVWVEAGDLGRFRTGVNSGGSVGRLGYFIDLNTRQFDGSRDKEQDDRDQISTKFIYNLSTDTRFIARVEHFEEDQIKRADLTEQEIKDDPEQAGKLSSDTALEQSSASLKVEHQINQHSIDAAFVVREKDIVGVTRFGGPQDTSDRGYQGRFVYKYDWDHSNIVAGFDAYQGKEDIKKYDRSDLELNGPYDSSDTELSVMAYFSQYQINLHEALTITAGLRFEEVETQASNFSQKADFDALAPKLGFTYQLNETNTWWMNVAEGFYAPNVDDLYNSDTGNPDLKAEESINFETGLRGTLGDFYYETGYYHNEISNYLVDQEFEENGIEFERTTNAGEVTVQGLETVMEYAPQSIDWRFGITHTLAYNKYDDFNSADGDYSGNELARSPRHHVNARIAWLPIENLVTELEGDFYSSYYSDDANSNEGEFTRDERINLRVSYTIQQWRLWVNALNLTDTIEDRATFRRDTLKIRTASGRSYYAGVSYTF